MYVSAAETTLRDRVATLYGKVGKVSNGDRVEVLEKQRRFVRVRTDKGQEGWIEERSLVSQDIYDGFQKLAKDSASMPVAAHGTTRAELNMHIEPARDADHLYQLKEGEKLEILKRATTDKNAKKVAEAAAKAAKAEAANPDSSPNPAPPEPAPPKPPPAKAASSKKPSTQKASTKAASAAKAEPTAEPQAPQSVWEDWYQVRDQSGHVGWVLLRMVDLDVPLDIAQYAEGQRITGYFVLNTVDETQDDATKQVPQYLVLLNEPKDGPGITTRFGFSRAIGPSIVTRRPIASATWKATSRSRSAIRSSTRKATCRRSRFARRTIKARLSPPPIS